MTRHVVETVRTVDAAAAPIVTFGLLGDHRTHNIRIHHRRRANQITDRDVVEAIAGRLEGHEVSYAEARWQRAACDWENGRLPRR